MRRGRVDSLFDNDVVNIHAGDDFCRTISSVDLDLERVAGRILDAGNKWWAGFL